MEKKLCTGLIVALITVIGAGCSSQRTARPGNSRIAFVSIAPLKYFVQRVAGDRFSTHTLVGSGQSPHSFTPSPAQMAALSEATVLFRTGVEFEDAVVPKIVATMPRLDVVDLREGIELLVLDPEGHDDPEHDLDHDGDSGESEHHHHGGFDPHVWLSPVNAKIMARTIHDFFVKKDPSGTAVYNSNLEVFLTELDSLDAFLHMILDPLKETELFVFHPAFGYFAHEYGLHQRAVETGGTEPGARALARLIDAARAEHPSVIFVQPQFSQKSARAIAEQIGCAVVSIDPLPQDYLVEMRALGESVREGLEGK